MTMLDKARAFLAQHPELTACPLCTNGWATSRGYRDERCGCEGRRVLWHNNEATERARKVTIRIWRCHLGWGYHVEDDYTKPAATIFRGPGDYPDTATACADAELARDAHLEALGVLEEDRK